MATPTFPPYQRRQKAQAEQEARTVDKGHGRREYRRLTSTTLLNGYLDWPDVGQVFELERVRVVGDKTSVEVGHGITSLGRDQAEASRLLNLTRGHWGIENGLHWVLDVAFGEDARRLYDRTAAENVGLLNRLATSLLREDPAQGSLKVKRKRAGWNTDYLAQLLGIPSP